jgi:hypothetical protein
MIKRFFSLLILAAIIPSCNNAGKKDVASTQVKVEGIEIVNFDTLVAHTENYVGRNIMVEGKVVHVCTESGKKLFIVGTNPDVRLYIQAGENMPKFPMDLLGSQVMVEGKIAKTGGETMAMAEGEKMGTDKKACETESALAVQTSLADVVMDYKSHTVK